MDSETNQDTEESVEPNQSKKNGKEGSQEVSKMEDNEESIEPTQSKKSSVAPNSADEMPQGLIPATKEARSSVIENLSQVVHAGSARVSNLESIPNATPPSEMETVALPDSKRDNLEMQESQPRYEPGSIYGLELDIEALLEDGYAQVPVESSNMEYPNAPEIQRLSKREADMEALQKLMPAKASIQSSKPNTPRASERLSKQVSVPVSGEEEVKYATFEELKAQSQSRKSLVQQRSSLVKAKQAKQTKKGHSDMDELKKEVTMVRYCYSIDITKVCLVKSLLFFSPKKASVTECNGTEKMQSCFRIVYVSSFLVKSGFLSSF